MSLTTFEKNKIRIALLLELNNCFTRVSKHYDEYGGEAEHEFLQQLIASIKDCVEGETRPDG